MSTETVNRVCLDLIMDLVDAGKKISWARWSPELRQEILNEFIKSGITFCRSKSPSSASFPFDGFLDDMKRLDLRRDTGYRQYLLNGFVRYVRQSPAIAENLIDLCLNARLNIQLEIHSQIERQQCINDVKAVIDMVGLCKRLEMLTLRFVGPTHVSSVVEMLNPVGQFDVCSSWVPAETYLAEIAKFKHIPRLKELGLESTLKDDLTDVGTLLMHLKCLRKLTLRGFDVLPCFWTTFMKNCRLTLEHVSVTNGSVGDEIVPVSLPKLRYFETRMVIERCSELFIGNICQCHVLQHLSIVLTGTESEEVLQSLLELPALKTIAMVVDGSTKTLARISTMFGVRIDCATIRNTDQLCDLLAFRRFVVSCPNLRSLDISEMSRDVAAIITLIFADKARAEKLTSVELKGELPRQLVDSLFANCTNLDTLKVIDCPQTTYSLMSNRLACPRVFVVKQIEDRNPYSDWSMDRNYPLNYDNHYDSYYREDDPY